MLNFLGALALTYWLSRLLLHVPRKWDGNPVRLILAHLGSLLLASLLFYLKSGLGSVPLSYAISQAIWLLVDGTRMRRRLV